MPPDPAAESLRLLHAERDQLEAELDGLMRKTDELMRDRIDLTQRVDDLRTFEGEYRTRLIAYLDGLVTTLKMEGGL